MLVVAENARIWDADIDPAIFANMIVTKVAVRLATKLLRRGKNFAATLLHRGKQPITL
jgi:hypothetical protein